MSVQISRVNAIFGNVWHTAVMKHSNSVIFVLTLAFAASAATPAAAYIEPGTGSMILQLLLGGAVGFFAIFKLYWHRFKAWLSPASTGQVADESADERGE